jgi:hypothetical protein
MTHASRPALILLIVLSVFMTGLSTEENTAEVKTSLVNPAEEKPLKATWLWQTYLTASEPDQILSFAAEQGVTLLYLKIDTSLTPAYYRSFIGKARAAGIDVHALGGKADWGLEQNRQDILALVDWVNQYNLAAGDHEKITGIHLDIEPYVLPAWKTDREAVIRQWMGNVEAYVGKIRQNPSLQIGCDLPFWLDNTPIPGSPDTSLAEWMIAKHDHVTVMAYRDRAAGPNSISSIVTQELEMADRYDKKVLVAVETKQSSEGNFITFFEEGSAYMDSELDKLPALMAEHPSFAGVAIHSFEYWKELER